MEQQNKHEGPSLLEYARFHGIAADFTSANNALEYVNQIHEIASEDLTSHEENVATFESHLSTVQSRIEQDLRKEKLDLRKEDARFLSMIIRDVKAEQIDIDWDSLLPSFNRIRRLKVETPILHIDSDTDILSLKKPVSYDHDDIELPPAEKYPRDCQMDILDSFLGMADKTIGNMKMEKLDCTKDSLVMIQNARKCVDLSLGDIEEPLGTLLGSCQMKPLEPTFSPLVPWKFEEELHVNPSPITSPYMLPSPVSSDPLERSEQQSRTLKTAILASKSPAEHIDEQTKIVQFNGNEIQDTAHDQPCGWKSPGPFEGQARSEYTTDGPVYTDMTEENGKEIISLVSISPRRSPYVNRFTTGEDTDSHAIYVSGSQPAELQTQYKVEETPPQTLHIGQEEEKYQKEPFYEGVLTAEAPHPSTKNIGGVLMTSTPTEYTTRKQHRQTTIPSDNDTQLSELPSATQSQKIYPDMKRHLPPTHTETRQSPRRKKGKHKKAHSIPQKQRNPSGMKVTSVADDPFEGPEQSTAFTALGSLSAYMETRGIGPKPKVVGKSPYFSDNKSKAVTNKEKTPEDMIDGCIDQRKTDDLCHTMSKISTRQIPQCHRKGKEPPSLFLSTALFKTHLRVVRALEEMDTPPRLIYRDYDTNSQHGQAKIQCSSSIPRHDPPSEADIIVSPTTGIILTTSQAMTQLYLPGHKPYHPQMNSIQCVNSPLRERIISLALRYEQLYVFLCHSVPTTKKSQGKSAIPTADKRTLAALASLTVFCTSASAYSTIIPLVIPPPPETVAEWILALSYKHSFRLRDTGVESSKSIGFTPVNPGHKVRFELAGIENETRWEQFLRQAGLNPFAAQAILAVLREERKEELAMMHLRGDMLGHAERNVGGLGRFIEMPSMQRRQVFGELIGQRVLKRVEDIIDKDWHCDWALNFDANGGL
ncbi:hypothetical protein ASPWEDRAFT_182542 [Aspergillus wentii DTO 134E9]|uniref:Uncharacterized protein n=1 Tax=Aspergillus wentii DTO 134E9 TaxID=1073089 RepID=A0A1L9RS63_ASPWE|nr:uncharacterized protein ASPWEDRAFT_182542 [Aspergillus wentii DTO 134E9]OJJ37698.1 hypothetical protein ASPWEDRAFT_182542 [Aspergillus wentii DTO 134E9]